MPYRWLARHQTRRVFDALSRGDYETALARVTDDVEHRFAGEHPLSGERHDRDALRAWFERLYRLFPRLHFVVHDVVASGPPWRITVTVEWSADVTPAHGAPYRSRGAHVVRVRRGRVAQLHAYEDSQAVFRACSLMAQHGIEEASAPPIINAM
jgi:ketosteroid isomerase-like protein